LFELHDKSSPFNSAHYVVLYPQNGGSIVTVDSVTSLQPVYNGRRNGGSNFKSRWTVVELLTDKKKKQKRQTKTTKNPKNIAGHSITVQQGYAIGLA